MTGDMLGNPTGSQETEGVLHIIFSKHFNLHVCITAQDGWVNLNKHKRKKLNEQS